MTGFEGKVEGAVNFGSSLSVSEGYNDNLFFTERNRVADSTTSIGPSLNLKYNSRNLALSGIYRGTAELHVRHPDANRYTQSASLSLGGPLLSGQAKGVEVRITEDVSYAPEIPAYSWNGLGGGNAGIQLQRTDTLVNRAGMELEYTWSPLLKSTLSYLNTLARYRGSVLNDSVNHHAGMAGKYQWSPRTQWTASYAASVTVFKQNDEVWVHRITLGTEHQIAPSLSSDMSIGAAFFHNESPRMTLGAGLSERYQSGRLSLRYDDNIATGLGLTTMPAVNQRVTGQATRALGPNASAYLRFAYGSNRSFNGEKLKISTYTAETGLDIRLLSWLSGNLGYSYLNQQSQTNLGQDGRRNQVILTLTAGSPSWKIAE